MGSGWDNSPLLFYSCEYFLFCTSVRKLFIHVYLSCTLNTWDEELYVERLSPFRYLSSRSQIERLEQGSTPDVGSSRITILDPPTNAMATDSFLCIPPVQVLQTGRDRPYMSCVKCKLGAEHKREGLRRIHGHLEQTKTLPWFIYALIIKLNRIHNCQFPLAVLQLSNICNLR